MSLSTVIEPHPTIADVDLQPIAVVLQLVHPARTSWGLLGDDWLARMNENGVALAATAWPYYGYGYDSCVQWVPDYGWVNVCGYPYGGYGYGGYGYY